MTYEPNKAYVRIHSNDFIVPVLWSTILWAAVQKSLCDMAIKWSAGHLPGNKEPSPTLVNARAHTAIIFAKKSVDYNNLAGTLFSGGATLKACLWSSNLRPRVCQQKWDRTTHHNHLCIDQLRPWTSYLDGETMESSRSQQAFMNAGNDLHRIDNLKEYFNQIPNFIVMYHCHILPLVWNSILVLAVIFLPEYHIQEHSCIRITAPPWLSILTGGYTATFEALFLNGRL